MKELQFLNIINKTLSDNSLLGEDCAFLEDLGLFITQDTLCEGVHFDLNFTDFYTLGQKAVNVNLSDLAANLAKPLYISISISAPEKTGTKEIEKFYLGVEKCCKNFGITVCGGDLTGSKSGLVISICALGKPYGADAPKVSRGFAKENQFVCVTKDYGSSAYGLYCLQNKIKCSQNFLNAQLNPQPDLKISEALSKLNCEKIAIMDSSDGLCDALFKIAKNSNVSIDTDFEKIPYDKEIENYKGDFKDLILWGGEDFGLVFCVDENDYKKLKTDFENIRKIGLVKPINPKYYVKIDDLTIDEKIFLKKSFNHFGNNGR